MPDYDFRSLSPIDFEVLVRDLLQKELALTLESFKPGKDAGVDLRHYVADGRSLIVQCKHFFQSGLKALLANLERNELPKVKKLNPGNYSVATSVSLNPSDKDRIVDIFYPYCKGPQFVYGREDLNNMLGRHPEVEKSHVKLWICGGAILEHIVHSQIFNTSRDELESIARRSKVYVYNKSFNEAVSILNRGNFCIIAGLPGIGKTTLAEMLVLFYLQEGYELVRIASHIQEANAVDFGDRKRIFYYDDFLVQSSLADKLGKNEDQRLLAFIENLRHSRVSKLILTTREYILNQAKVRYERLSNAKFDLDTCTIDLSKYSRLNKGEILFNHLFFSRLPQDYKDAILSENGFLKIIDHPNYSPRLIETLTQVSSILGVRPEEYTNFVLRNLSEPFEIWGHAFDSQIQVSSRALLLVMASLPRICLFEDVRTAFTQFHLCRSKLEGLQIKDRDFTHAAKELDGNFVTFSGSTSTLTATFANPSIRDFVEATCVNDVSLLTPLIEGSAFFEQLVWLACFRAGPTKTQPFLDLIDTHSVSYVNRLRETFAAATCLTKTDWLWSSDGYTDSITRSSMSQESRLSDLLRIHSFWPNEHLTMLIDSLIDDALVSWRLGEGIPEDIPDLVARIDVSNWSGKLQVIKQAAVERIVLSADSIEGFKLLSDMNEESELDRQSEGFLTAKARFEQVARSETRDWLSGEASNDPDDIRDFATGVEALGKLFDVKVTQFATDLEEFARYKEEYREPSSIRGRSDALASDSSPVSDEVLASLFGLLSPASNEAVGS